METLICSIYVSQLLMALEYEYLGNSLNYQMRSTRIIGGCCGI